MSDLTYHLPAFVDKSVKWKSGPIEDLLPFTEDFENYEDLRKSSAFRDYLLNHPNDCYIISKLLDESGDDNPLHAGIDAMKEYNDDEVAQARQHFQHFNSLHIVGANVKLEESIDIVDRMLKCQFAGNKVPFLDLNQRRLALYSSLAESVQYSRKQYSKNKRSREWKQNTLNSATHPEVTVIHSLQSFGIGMLKFVPLYLKSMGNNLGPLHSDVIQPILTLCEQINQLEELELFSTWAPRERQPLRQIDLTSATITSSDESHKPKTSNLQTLQWQNQGGYCIVSLPTPQCIQWLQLSWISNGLVTAPDSIGLFVKREGEAYKKVSTYNIENETRKQGSWVQMYYIGIENVKEVKVVFSRKICEMNDSTFIQMHALSLFSDDKKLAWIHNLATYHEVQQSLLPFLEFENLNKKVLLSIIRLLRSCASLSLLLSFVEYILNHSYPHFSIDEDLAAEMLQLLDSIYREYHRVKLDFEKRAETKIVEVENVVFDEKRKSPSIEILQDGKAIRTGTDKGYIALNTALGEGLTRWTFLCKNLTSWSCGLIMSNAKFEDPVIDSKKTWLLRVDRNMIMAKGEEVGQLFHTANSTEDLLLSFQYNSKTMQLSVALDSQPPETMLDCIPSGYIPILIVESDTEDSCAIIELKSFQKINLSSVGNDMSLQLESVAFSRPSSLLEFADSTLAVLSALCRLHLQIQETIPEYSNQLEEAFSTEVSSKVIQKLTDLMSNRALNPELVPPLLAVLELQLSSLNTSTITLSEIEFPFEYRDINDFGILQTKKLLQDLTKLGNETIQLSASKVFSKGVELFFPLVIDRIKLIIEILAGWQSTSILDKSLENIILSALESISRLDRISETVMVLHQPETASILKDFVSILLLFLRQLEVKSFRKEFNQDQLTASITAYLQTLVFEVDRTLQTSIDPCTKDPFAAFMCYTLSALCTECKNLVRDSWDFHIAAKGSEHSLEYLFQHSFMAKLVPLGFALVVNNKFPLYHIVSIMPFITDYVIEVNRISSQTKIHYDTMFSLAASFRSMHGVQKGTTGVRGWKTIKAAFEEADSTFNITDNGTTYTSVSSSNTCAIVNQKFCRGQKGAWEFHLETDSMNDECSVFGAAKQPLSSRCYTSSPDLWMRRAYNGYMYCLGQTTGNSLNKIHPGDTVRMEFDGIAGTLSYSVNGATPEVGFTDITDDIYPACGSYRNGVVVKLTKVEIYDQIEDVGEDGVLGEYYPSPSVSWVSTSSSSKQPHSTLVHPASTDKDSSGTVNYTKWYSSRINKGILSGKHSWSFEVSSAMQGSFSFGLVGENVLIDINRISSIRNESFVWNSDGSLWINGVKRAVGYGEKLWPNKGKLIIKLLVDRWQGSVEFFINGKSAGLAFGPQGSFAKCEMAIPPTQDLGLLFPAVSISHPSAKIKVLASGMLGSTELPTLLSLSISSASIVSRLAALLVQGSSIQKMEIPLVNWFQSPIFVGGLDARFLRQLQTAEDLNYVEDLKQGFHDHFQSATEESLSISDEIICSLATCTAFDSLESTSSPLRILYDWLETIDPEPIALRKALEKNSTFRFPKCELPLMACLVKHSDMGEELGRIFAAIKQQGESFNMEPSENMNLIFQKVKQLRTYLRKQRQSMKAKAPVKELGNDFVGDSLEAWQKLLQSLTYLEDPGIHYRALLVETVEITNSYQVNICKCSFSASGSCLFLVVEIKATDEITKLDNKDKIAIKFDEVEYAISERCIISSEIESGHHCITLGGWIDLSIQPVKVNDIPLMTFLYGDKSVSSYKLELKVDSAVEEIGKGWEQEFESLCQDVASRAIFLCCMKAIGPLNNLSEKSSLIGLASFYSTNNFSSRSMSDTSRLRTQERWKRVIEFLHTQSKMRRQRSRSDELNELLPIQVPSVSFDVSTVEDHKYEVSNSQAVIQACSVFVSSPDIDCNITSLFQLVKVRMARAEHRSLGLKCFHKLLEESEIIDNPFILSEILTLAKCCIPPSNIMQNKKPVKVTSTNHYLCHLEGCSSSMLEVVQVSVSTLYKRIVEVLRIYIQNWESGIRRSSTSHMDPLSIFDATGSTNSSIFTQSFYVGIITMLKLINIQFSSRDHSWLLDSDIFSVLHKLSSFTFKEEVWNITGSSAREFVQFVKKKDIRTLTTNAPFSNLWSWEYLSSALKDGSMSIKRLLGHLLEFVCTTWKNEEDDTKLMEKIKQAFCDQTTTLLYATELFAELSSRVKVREVKDQTSSNLTCMVDSSGICTLDPSKKAARIGLSDYNLIASLAEDASGSSICVFGTRAYKSTLVEELGNYFEATILSLGHGDIGIGFADRVSFHFVGNMPGWVIHSYAYHGDDGKKYGVNNSPGDWPLFETGDVIGCGWDFDRKVIYFTRNGVLLGDGFIDIQEVELWPVIGFSNRHNDFVQVRMNFGAEKFSFESQVTIGKLAADLRAKTQSKLGSETGISRNSLLQDYLRKDEEVICPADIPEHLWVEYFKRILDDCQHAEAVRMQHSNFECIGLNLINIFALLTMRTESEQYSNIPILANFANIDASKFLMRGVSAFGTSAESTGNNFVLLQKSMLACNVQELVVATEYLLQAEFSSSSLREIQDQQLGLVVLSSSTTIKSSLDNFQIKCKLENILLSIHLMIDASDTLRSEFKTSTGFVALLQLLDLGSLLNIHSAISLLKKLLPDTDPEYVENRIPSSWKKQVEEYESVTIDQFSGRKSRKIPDTIVRKLLLLASNAYVVEHNNVQNQSERFIGEGDAVIKKSKLALSLLQVLFEIPLWEEIVAFNTTSALRHAELAFISMNVGTSTRIPTNKVFAVATAAMQILSLEAELDVGSRIELANGSLGVIVSTENADGLLAVALDVHSKDFSCLKQIEMVERKDIKLKNRIVRVDFSKLSQPIISQMISLMKGLLEAVLSDHAVDFVVQVTCAILSSIDKLLQQQQEVVVETLLDLGAVDVFVSIAAQSRSSPFPNLLTLAKLKTLARFVEARNLEFITEKLEDLDECSHSPKVQRALADSSDQSNDQYCMINLEERTSHQAVAKRLEEQTGVKESRCLQLLEYNMMDEARTLDMLLAEDKEIIAIEEDSAVATVGVDVNGLKVEMSDESMLKGIEYADANSGAISTGHMDGCKWKLRKLDEKATNGLLVTNTEVEGICYGDIDSFSRIHETMQDDSVIIHIYDHLRQLQIARPVSLAALRQVNSVEDVDLSSLKNHSNSIHILLNIMYIRDILLKLISQGMINSSHLGNTAIEQLKLLKLSIATSDPSYSKSLLALSNVLMPAPDNGSASSNKDISVIMIEDAIHSLESICNLSSVFQQKQSESIGEGVRKLTFGSVHPFRTPFETSGKIVVPKDWNGMRIQFDPRCQTPSNKAKLEFYTSLETFQRRKADFSFWGGKGEKHYFSNLHLNSTFNLYYRFSAAKNSHLRPLEIKVQQGNIKCTGEVWSLTTDTVVDRVGLGDDDTLFNLFGTEEVVQTEVTCSDISTIVLDCMTITSGTFAFQVKIQEGNHLKDENNHHFAAIGWQREGIICSEKYIVGMEEGSASVTSEGKLLKNGEEIENISAVIGSWTAGDVITVVFSLTGENLRFACGKNDIWSPIRCFPWELYVGVKPVISLSGKWSVLPVTDCISLPDCMQEAFGEVRSIISQQDTAKTSENSWGYQFSVLPLERLRFHVTRDFELIWNAKEEDVSKDEVKALWIWRPKAFGDFVPMSDIITTTAYPPRRSILVHKSQGKKPMKFVCVFYSSKQNFVVWRAISEDGFVSMGDVVTKGNSAGSPPSTTGFLCVPTWSVIENEVCNRYSTIKKVGEGKLCYTASLWGSDSSFGYFFGSPYDGKKSDLPLHADFKCHGVANGYSFSKDIESSVLAEWFHEDQVISNPSLSFSLGVLDNFIHNPKWNSLMIQDHLFTKLINYMKTNTAAAPFRVIPVLIQMIRRAFVEHRTLPYQDVKNLCRVILTEAVAMVQSLKTEIPKSLMALVDFVVEIQAAHVIESGIKDRHAISRIIKKEKFRLDWVEETKEEVDADHMIESKEDENPVLGSSAAAEKYWWERPVMNSNELKFHRVIRRESMENIFAKEPILLKLKQVLKFLYAVNTPDSELLSMSIDQNALERSFPKLMTSKLWFELISTCSLIESQHPYRERSFYKKVSFPGVQYLSISLDRRCALSAGDKLILRTDSKTVEIIGGTENSNESLIKKGAQFIANTIEIIFERNVSTDTINVDHEWGWAILVSASGPIYEQAELSIDLQNAVTCLSESTPSVEEDLAKLSLDQKDGSFSPTPTSNSVISSPIAENKKYHHKEEQDSMLEDVLESPDLESPSSGIVKETPKLESEEVVSVGISSADIALDFEGLLPRPKTKRGKRTPEAENKDIIEAKLPLPLKESENKPIDPEIEAILKVGSVLQSGELQVPYASELEIRVERVTPKNAEKDYLDTSYVIVLKGSKAGAEDCKQFKVSPNWYTKMNMTGSRVDYILYGMKTARLQKILDAQLPPKPAPDGIHSRSEDKVDSTDEPLLTVRSLDSNSPEDIVQKVFDVEAEAISAVSTWSCEMCTYFNDAEEPVCSMCGSSRPGESPTAAAIPAAVALWFCPLCTLLNPLTSSSCSACGTARPGDALPVEESSPEEERDEDAEDDEEESEDAESRPLTPVPSEKVGSSTPSSPTKSTITESDQIKISCKGKLDNFARFETRLEAALLSKGTILTPLQVHHRVSKWTKECDYALIDYLNSLKSNKSDLNAFPLSFAISKQFLTYQGLALAKLSMLDIIIRAQLIESFNRQLESLLPLIDLSNDDPASLGAMIRKSNRYLLTKVKSPLLEKAITSTAAKGTESDVPANITLDNYKALNSRERNDKEPSTSQNCFVQCFRQLQKKDSVVYRHLFSGDRVFQISFVNESGIDAGGVYREGLSRVSEDLFSENFNLLVLCPNGQQAVHSGMDKYLPNPKHSGPLAMEMFEFIGKLMAMSIRSKACLSFEFPPLVWKKIVGEDVCNEDLLEIDMITSRQLDDIENCHRDPEEPIFDQDGFFKKFLGKLKFTYIGLDNVEHELIVNGRLQEVTFENRFEYCNLVRTVRLNDCNVQVAAMAKGMGEVIPMRALLLFSATQLEELVCGSPKIDIDLWKSQTESSGLSANTVKMFWKVMESLPPKDQAGFIRFAWGRSRLPNRKEDFTMKMKLTSGGRAALPVSHTCFFSIELPEYHTEEEMRHGLLTAIHFGVGGILNG